jgi:acyl-CoA thioester hydrolase
MFQYSRIVQFYETDLMGIVHHSNYLRFFEEARVAWAHDKNIIDYQKPESASHLAVIETGVRHLKPAKFGDNLTVQVQAKLDGIRISFQYKIFVKSKYETPVAQGFSLHVPLDSALKPMRPSSEIKKILEKEKWIETWL